MLTKKSTHVHAREAGNTTQHDVLTPTDWDYLLEERIGIMIEDRSVTEARARALAIQDTICRHGQRPKLIDLAPSQASGVVTQRKHLPEAV